MALALSITKRTDPRLLACMEGHYSQPKGFVGRNICYAILWAGVYFGHIVGGSSTLHLPGRHEVLGTSKTDLNRIVNNIFFHAVKQDGRYPARNFTEKVLAEYRQAIEKDWQDRYGDPVVGHESLVELPRTGECYRRDGWLEVGVTKGYTCKRVGGAGTDEWSGKRVWDTANLRPKRVFVRKVVQDFG